MSIRAISLVWERTRAKGSNLLLLLAIADYAKDDGRWAWPSARTLTAKTRLTGRGGELILARLVADGEVWPEWNADESRLYLHVRCVCDWDTYRTEGPVFECEKFSRNQSEKFSRKLLLLAAKRLPRANGAAAKANTAASASSSSDPLDPSKRDPSRARVGHHRHAFCPADGQDGFCVPDFLHRELDTMLGAHAAEFDLLGWYVSADRRRRDEQPTVLDGLNFWRDALRAELQQRGWITRRQVPPRGAARLPTALDAYRDWVCPHTPPCGHPTPCRTLVDLDRYKKASGS